jgi:SAM-dependent methyltransferase
MADSAQKNLSGYEQKYVTGAGWKYDYAAERTDLKRITDALGLKPGDAVLEIGCGEGFHTKILYDLGFRVIGNEQTEAGITSARRQHPLVNYIQGDSLGLLDILPREHFDMILARGHSWWHYQLTADNPRGIDVPGNTRKMFELLKPGGFFVLRIRTDFSGTHPKGSVANNTRQAYVDLFSPLGRVVYVTDSLGNLLPDEEAARRSGKSIVIATRKPSPPREPSPPLHEHVRRRVLHRIRSLHKRVASSWAEFRR